ncbi:MAG TPA: hypothetical protein VGW98_11785 [Solirubrobacteraceae bacterium]|jgi:Tol biopolymer transport system component|nr:hypothetical protein [Solirubrobacteraceae bacterium]
MSVPMRLTLCLVATLMLPLGLVCAPAGADVFGSISLVSTSPSEQADYAHDPAVSANGRYVVFDGSIGGVTGVWRRELRREDGVVSHEGNAEEVAGGDAELPSISENGQYVSFTTNEGKALPEITNGLPDPVHQIGEGPTVEAPNVYVRNMGFAPAEAGAFEVVSAVNGSTEPLTYEYATHGEGVAEKELRREESERYGSLAAGRSALSADGRKVAFVTTAPSNLDGSATPALEVAVRDLDTESTEVVSVEYDPTTGEPAIDEETGLPKPARAEMEAAETYGGAFSEGKPPPFAPAEPYKVRSTIGASISADGSTVAWLGQDIGEQAPTLPGETLYARYAEPLWRRIADGPAAPTRRVSGGSDPRNPACVASGETVLPREASLSDPCQGPFRTEAAFGLWSDQLVGEADALPRLSADGYKVAFISTAPLISQGSDFGGASPGEHHGDDVYVADMREGLSRQQALRQLTELASGNEAHEADNAPVVDLDISPDASQVAFATRRIVFPLGSPAYVSAPLTVPGMLELYDVDLENDTLTRVTHGYTGGPSEHPHKVVNANDEDQYLSQGDGAQSPSFSADGDLLAFSSTASNLIFGDGNTPPLGDERLDGSDTFVVPRVVFEAVPTPQLISAAPPNPSLSPSWSLGVTASSLSNGSVRLRVEVPGSGVLHADANATVKVAPARSARRFKGRRARLLTRTVATTKPLTDPSAGGLTTLVMTPASSYAALTERPGGLTANAEVSFAAPGHPTLRERIEVSFVRKPHAKTPKGRSR